MNRRGFLSLFSAAPAAALIAKTLDGLKLAPAQGHGHLHTVAEPPAHTHTIRFLHGADSRFGGAEAVR
jgi:hypothetical protein